MRKGSVLETGSVPDKPRLCGYGALVSKFNVKMKKRYLSKELCERERIVKKTKQRPYGARVTVAVGTGFGGTKLLDIDQHASLRLDDDLIIEVKRARNHNDRWWKYNLAVKAFASAGEAEEAGLRLAQAILWMSVSARNPRLMLRYNGPLPCDVFDRRKSGGISMHARATVRTAIERQYRALEEGWKRKDVNRRLLLAMELFCAARFEATARARFIGIVSSLEPLAQQARYDHEAFGPTIEDTVSKAVASIEGADDIPDYVRRSLVGRLQNLRRESVRHAYRRLASKHLEDEDVHALDEAYNIRSKMLHEGESDPDLSNVTNTVENLVRAVLAGEMQLDCVSVPYRK